MPALFTWTSKIHYAYNKKGAAVFIAHKESIMRDLYPRWLFFMPINRLQQNLILTLHSHVFAVTLAEYYEVRTQGKNLNRVETSSPLF